MITEQAKQEIIIKKFELLSDKYHKMSLLFYELAQSLRQEAKRKDFKEFKAYIKSLNIDIEKLKMISSLPVGFADFKKDEIKKENEKNA